MEKDFKQYPGGEVYQRQGCQPPRLRLALKQPAPARPGPAPTVEKASPVRPEGLGGLAGGQPIDLLLLFLAEVLTVSILPPS
ncbi:MAG: hypothetical protein LQ349_006641 [Xanthoria aureola]|nr:MAG: hypothetical protein LQ349_006641 [Xanthoria aureola]